MFSNIINMLVKINFLKKLKRLFEVDKIVEKFNFIFSKMP